MANNIEIAGNVDFNSEGMKLTDANGVTRFTAEFERPASEKPEVADKPHFLRDLANGFKGTLVTVAKTVWQVPAAQGYIATLIVRAGLPAGIAAILVPIIDAFVK